MLLLFVLHPMHTMEAPSETSVVKTEYESTASRYLRTSTEKKIPHNHNKCDRVHRVTDKPCHATYACTDK